MSVNIAGPTNNAVKPGLKASVGNGVTYTGIESLPLPSENRWYTSAGYNVEYAPCEGLQTGAICVNDRPFAPGRPSVVEGKALQLESQVQCSTYGTEASMLEEYAKEVFNRQLFASISSEIWSGTVARNAGFVGNQYLANNDSANFVDLAPGDTTTLKDAIAMLDQYLSCCNPGGPGLIHVPTKAYDYMGAEHLFSDTGSSLRQTWSGNTVVGECGYAGTGPDSFANGPIPLDPGAPADVWLYATGPMFIRAAADLTPLTVIDPLQNDISTVVRGTFAYGWGCCHAGIKVNLCPR